jgi:glycine/D-amino acid oxidase-like deaminating enzyme
VTGPAVDPVHTGTDQPRRAGVVVIGGGIAGVCTAFTLAQRGVDVTLCEKGHIAGEQSSRNWGWVRKQGRDPREIPLIIESLRIWEGLNATVGGETGFRTTGNIALSITEGDMARRLAWLEHARAYQIDTRLLSGAEANRLMPGAAVKFAAALTTPSDGQAEPQKAVPAIARAAQALGATILTNTAVRGLDVTAGRISGVVTEHGRIACDSVVLAGGAWSRLFCGSLGLALPQLKLRSGALRTEPVAGGPEIAAICERLAFRKRLDGGYTVASFLMQGEITPDAFRLLVPFLPQVKKEGPNLKLRVSEQFMAELRRPKRWSLEAPSPFEQVRVFDPKPLEADAEAARSRLAEIFPVFRGVKVAQHWGGMIDVTPDAIPVISPVASLPGFHIATGFSGHGFGIGPGAGRLMADLVMGAPPIVDPAPFRFERFSQ